MALLSDAGGEPVLLPVLDIVPDERALAALPRLAADADWLIFVSPSAIDAAWPMLASVKLKGRLACVGAASAAKLAALSGRAVLHPRDGSDSAALLALPELQRLAGQRVLIVRGVGGRAELGETLAARGARLTLAEVYRRVDGEPDWSLLEPPVDALVLTSSDTAERLFRLAGRSRSLTLQCLLYCVPHPRIAATLAAHGVTRIVTTQADDDALVAGLSEWFTRHP
ncbi:uroporphyrinogen-III synthase [Pseudogulbenkiania subflava DSM 22618]|uniref:Uroporphyrinogen-III synthase n=2 Tax=Pseudogulbenkiania subflava TaxID=451637 RepID=A0A1Y6B7F4_9NEIS|nr:uroporphyrinogen-III synthase [Pseudogulbenkiania subflava DSM 22618]